MWDLYRSWCVRIFFFLIFKFYLKFHLTLTQFSKYIYENSPTSFGLPYMLAISIKYIVCSDQNTAITCPILYSKQLKS